jgi:hypothetical protein
MFLIQEVTRILNMTNRILAVGVVLASLAFPVPAMADENGLVGGAVAGAVGGVGGAAIGNAMTNHGPRHHHYRIHNRPYNEE